MNKLHVEKKLFFYLGLVFKNFIMRAQKTVNMDRCTASTIESKVSDYSDNKHPIFSWGWSQRWAQCVFMQEVLPTRSCGRTKSQCWEVLQRGEAWRDGVKLSVKPTETGTGHGHERWSQSGPCLPPWVCTPCLATCLNRVEVVALCP